MWLAALLAAAASFAPPPVDARFDYQIGEAYRPPAGVQVVSRDWTERPPARGYAVCYVNAFQYQPGIDWPDALVLRELGDDPGWPGEYLIDLSTAAKRRAAARFAAEDAARLRAQGVRRRRARQPRLVDAACRACRSGARDAIAYARLLSRRAHALGLAVAQKNTPQLTTRARLGPSTSRSPRSAAATASAARTGASTATASSRSSTGAATSGRRAGRWAIASRWCCATVTSPRRDRGRTATTSADVDFAPRRSSSRVNALDPGGHHGARSSSRSSSRSTA